MYPETAPSPTPKLSELTREFVIYARAQENLAAPSVAKYEECLGHVARILGDREVTSYIPDDLLQLQDALLSKGLSVSRRASILIAFKRLLGFASEWKRLPVIDHALIRIPRQPRREVVYLTKEEVQRFVDAIQLTGYRGRPLLRGVRFRALVEMLLGSGLRISELLFLNIEDLNVATREARVIGKGNKQRIAFFSERAIHWMSRYLALKNAVSGPLFTTQNSESRLKKIDIWRPFASITGKAGLAKRVTPHLLRHTAATQMLFNGCPIAHIKEILGHERLETTCRYYLGLDRSAAKQAHAAYLRF